MKKIALFLVICLLMQCICVTVIAEEEPAADLLVEEAVIEELVVEEPQAETSEAEGSKAKEPAAEASEAEESEQGEPAAAVPETEIPAEEKSATEEPASAEIEPEAYKGSESAADEPVANKEATVEIPVANEGLDQVSDNVAPTLEAITIRENGQALGVGGTVHVTVKVTDSHAIEEVHGWLRKPGDVGYVSMRYRYNGTTDLYEGEYTFTGNDLPGQYDFDEIYAKDEYGNWHYLGGSVYGKVFFLGSGSGTGTSVEVVSATITENGSNVTPGSKIHYKVLMKNLDPAQTDYLEVILRQPNGNGYGTGLEFNAATGYWEGEFSGFSARSINGIHVLGAIDGNFRKDGQTADFHIELDETALPEQYVVMTGGTDDAAGPTIHGVIFIQNGKTLTVGDVIQVNVSVSDPSGVSSVYAYFTGPYASSPTKDYRTQHESTGTEGISLELEKDAASGLWIGKTTLFDTLVNAKYTLESVDAEDGSGNWTYFDTSNANVWFTFTGPDVVSEYINDFVERCYNIIFNRAVDASGKKYWGEELASGRKSAADIVYGLMGSKEFKNMNRSNAQIVQILYRTMLDRAPDAGGLQYWVTMLEDGKGISAIVNGFCGSKEFREICQRFGIKPGSVSREAEITAITMVADREKVKAFITRCYNVALERAPEAGGLDYWIGIILTGKMSPQEVAHGFVFSKEMNDKNLSDVDFVRTLYKLYMNRLPDQAGLVYWASQMAGGMSRETVNAGFASSKEFSLILKSYGLLV